MARLCRAGGSGSSRGSGRETATQGWGVACEDVGTGCAKHSRPASGRGGGQAEVGAGGE